MIAWLSIGRRALFRALADHLVAAIARVADPSGSWTEIRGDLGADAGSPRR